MNRWNRRCKSRPSFKTSISKHTRNVLRSKRIHKKYAYLLLHPNGRKPEILSTFGISILRPPSTFSEVAGLYSEMGKCGFLFEHFKSIRFLPHWLSNVLFRNRKCPLSTISTDIFFIFLETLGKSIFNN